MGNISLKENNTGRAYIAFFDLDRTITNSISGNEMTKNMFKKGIISRKDIANALFTYLLYKLDLKDPLLIINMMINRLKDLPEESLAAICSDVVQKVLLPSVSTGARSEIKAHKERNARVVILSSAVVQICRAMSENLDIDDIICTALETEDGYLTGRTIGHPCFGKEKAVRLKEYCKRYNIDPSDCWYYGDSISDLPALIATGHPVCVNPDKKLKKFAGKNGWKIFYWE